VQRRFVLAIDIEPDEQKSGPGDSWKGTNLSLDELSSWRVQLEEVCQFPVRFNWFIRFDPQIERNWGRLDWATTACPDLIPTIQRHGDLAGIHVHLWKWHDRHAVWYNDFADAGWRAHCLGVSVEAYQSIFGARPVASRFGHRSIWNEDIPVLKRHGIQYDLTMEPRASGHALSGDPLATSSLPDYGRAPCIPYQPSVQDYLSPKPSGQRTDPGGDFWMVPITVTRRLHWLPLRRPPFLVRSALPMNLVLRPRRVWAQLRQELEKGGAEPLVLVLRSGDLAQPRWLSNFRFITKRLSANPAMRDCRFVPVDCAVREFAKTQLVAGHRHS
jgi:hypothetical protein